MIGYERKRGKLADLNALILTGRAEPFAHIVGNLSQLKSVKYVITLDTDTSPATRLCQELAGTMAHPLNRPAIQSETEPYRRRPRSFAAPGDHQLVGSIAIDLFAAHRERTWTRSLYPCRLRRVPGHLLRRFVHRQGNLRRRGVRMCLARKVPREFHPQPRLAGRVLCALRFGQRHPTVRRYPGNLSCGCGSPPTMDPGRLAIDPVAISLRADQQGQAAEEHPVLPVQMEDPGTISAGASPRPSSRRSWFSVGSYCPTPLAWTLVISALLLIPPLVISFVAFFQKPQDMPRGAHIASTVHSFVPTTVRGHPDRACLPHDAYFSLHAILRTCLANGLLPPASSPMASIGSQQARHLPDPGPPRSASCG